MVAVDAVRPPEKGSKATATVKTKKISSQKKEVSAMRPHPRHRLLWALVIGTTAIIFLAWLFLFPKPSTNQSASSYFDTLGQKISSLWRSIKTDILKIKEITNSTSTNSTDEQINQLENQVFPQFKDPTKQ